MEKATSLPIFESLLLDYVVEEFAARHEFHDQEQLPRRLNNLVQLHDVRMPHYLQDLNFAHHSRNVCLLLDFVLFQYFNRDFF